MCMARMTRAAVLGTDALGCKQAPDAELLQEFLGRLPIIFNVAILSPHGFFGQKDVLGKPDTGGQVRQLAPPNPKLPESMLLTMRAL